MIRKLVGQSRQAASIWQRQKYYYYYQCHFYYPYCWSIIILFIRWQECDLDVELKSDDESINQTKSILTENCHSNHQLTSCDYILLYKRAVAYKIVPPFTDLPEVYYGDYPNSTQYPIPGTVESCVGQTHTRRVRIEGERFMAHLPELSNFTELTMFLSATFASQIRRQGHFESFCQSPHCGAYNTIVMKAKPRDPANIRDAF